jgi:hypothetical protein
VQPTPTPAMRIQPGLLYGLILLQLPIAVTFIKLCLFPPSAGLGYAPQ